MTRPEFVDGYECPSCQSRDTVSLSLEKDCVGWCNCGIVWIIKNEDKRSANVELVFSFSMPLEDAIARRRAEADKRESTEYDDHADNVVQFWRKQT